MTDPEPDLLARINLVRNELRIDFERYYALAWDHRDDLHLKGKSEGLAHALRIVESHLGRVFTH